jgi:hypothetical protein
LALALAATAAPAAFRPSAAVAQAAAARAAEPEPLYYKSRAFRIPFTVEESDRPRIKEVQLFVSTDLGQSWKRAIQTTPEQPAFPTFRAPRDAEYWFAVRTLDLKGRLFPTDDAEVVPSMKVVVDTVAPTIELAAMGRRGERAQVRWEVADEHLNLESLVIQYKAEGALDWRQVPIKQPARIGAQEWDAGTAAPLVVRAWVDDRAGNRATADLRLADGIANAPDGGSPDDRAFEPPPPIAPITSGGGGGPSGRFEGAAAPDAYAAQDRPFEPGFEDGEPAAEAPRRGDGAGAAAGGPRSLMVGSPRFALQYAVDDAGPDGPALVELWVTRDGGQTWSRQPEDADRRSPYEVDLGGEGTFGMWLVVQSAANMGDPPPRPGDRPQLWVEVDSTPPIVRLDPPRVGKDSALGKVLITWRVTDPHLGARPVLLSYRADRPDAPWTPIGDRLDNTGRYVWTVPPGVPARFHLRIDAVDTLGNRAFAESTANGPILVDRSRPRGRILGLDPNSVGGNGPDSASRR